MPAGFFSAGLPAVPTKWWCLSNAVVESVDDCSEKCQRTKEKAQHWVFSERGLNYLAKKQQQRQDEEVVIEKNFLIKKILLCRSFSFLTPGRVGVA